MVKLIADIIVSGGMVAGAVYLWFVADAFPVFEKYKNIDSDFWPKILLVLVVILAGGVFVQAVSRFLLHRRRNPEVRAAEVREKTPSNVDWKRFTVMAALCVGYFWGLQTLGFILATLTFLWIAVPFIGIRNRWGTLLFSPVFTFGLMLLFVRVLELSLPRGAWIFREISLLFY